MATTLERKKFQPRGVEVASNQSLLEDARNLLAYTPDALRKESSKVTHFVNETKVAEILDRLGIEPLDRAKVEAYKTEKMRQAVQKQSNRFVRYMHESSQYSGHIAKGEKAVMVTTIIGVITAIISLMTLLAYGNGHLVGVPFPAMLVAGLRLYWGFYLSAFCILMYARHKNATTITARWQDCAIGGYTSPIPDFALARAVAIKKEVPTANFRIEELDVTEHGVETRKHVPDPFMVLHFETVKLYLDVWDEPKFEGRRQI